MDGASPSLTEPTLSSRLMSRRAAILFVRNTIVSTAIFAFDLAILWVFVEMWGMEKVLAAAVAFVIANLVQYVFARGWVFRGTERPVVSGLTYFMANAMVGLGITLVAFWLLLQVSPFGYVIDRVLASVVAGLTVFLLNAVLNFRSL